MKVILIKDVAKVGRAYEIKEVADGYASNFLIARGLGLSATPATIRRLELEHKKAQRKTLSSNIPPQTKITIAAKANDMGHLFAGIHEQAIAAALKSQAQIDLPASAIQLDEPVRTIGEFVIKVQTNQMSGQFSLLIEHSPS